MYLVHTNFLYNFIRILRSSVQVALIGAEKPEWKDVIVGDDVTCMNF